GSRRGSQRPDSRGSATLVYSATGIGRVVTDKIRMTSLSTNAVLCVNLLSKTFHLHEQNTPIEAFRDVTFEVYPGVVTTLTGPDGSGKAVVLKCIYRTYRPTAGAILFRQSGSGWLDLTTAPDSTVLRIRKWEIGFVTQYLHCIPRQSALLVAS